MTKSRELEMRVYLLKAYKDGENLVPIWYIARNAISLNMRRDIGEEEGRY